MKPHSDGINAIETKYKNLQFGPTLLLFGMIGSQVRRGKFRRFNLTNVKSPVNTIILFPLSINIVSSFIKATVKVLCFEIFKFQFSLYIYCNSILPGHLIHKKSGFFHLLRICKLFDEYNFRNRACSAFFALMSYEH